MSIKLHTGTGERKSEQLVGVGSDRKATVVVVSLKGMRMLIVAGEEVLTRFTSVHLYSVFS